MDLFRRRCVGGRDHVEAELRDAKLSAFDGDGVNGLPGVGLLRIGNGGEILREALAVEAADENLGVSDGAVGPARIVHAMQREGGGVEIAFRHDASLVDEPLQVGTALNLRLVEVRCRAQRLQVDVDDRIALRKKAGRLRRRLGAEIECNGEGSQDCKSDCERDPRASSHQVLKVSLLANREGEDLACVGDAWDVRGARWKHTVFALLDIYGNGEHIHLRSNLVRVELYLVALRAGLGVKDAAGLDAKLAIVRVFAEAEEVIFLGLSADGRVDQDVDTGG